MTPAEFGDLVDRLLAEERHAALLVRTDGAVADIKAADAAFLKAYTAVLTAYDEATGGAK